jgi:hypothetical protein
MGDENECILPIPCTIQTDHDGSPEDDDMGPSAGQTLMENLDQMEELDLEVSGTMSTTDCSPLTEEDARLLEEIRNSKAGKEKGATINWPAFGESPIFEYRGEKCFLYVVSRTGLDNSYSWLTVGLRRIRHGASMHLIMLSAEEI